MQKSTYWDFKCQLTEALAEGEKILPVYSRDGENWVVMTGTAEAPLYIDMNGVRNSNDDPDDPNVRPINVSIRWNGFDDKYLAITGLDNSEYNDYNTDRISYGLANVAENVICVIP